MILIVMKVFIRVMSRVFVCMKKRFVVGRILLILFGVYEGLMSCVVFVVMLESSGLIVLMMRLVE